jgi:hypothetical protein
VKRNEKEKDMADILDETLKQVTEAQELVVSEAQASDPTALAATAERTLRNRRNAAHSTGPRSPAGKNRSRWNALTHGLLARTLVAGMDPKQQESQSFRLFYESLVAELRPVGVLEQLQLERAASAYYRLFRGASFENEIVTNRDTFWSDGVDRLNRYVSAANRELTSALHEFERLQRQRAGQVVTAPLVVEVNVNATASEPTGDSAYAMCTLPVAEIAASEDSPFSGSESLDANAEELDSAVSPEQASGDDAAANPEGEDPGVKNEIPLVDQTKPEAEETPQRLKVLPPLMVDALASIVGSEA